MKCEVAILVGLLVTGTACRDTSGPSERARPCTAAELDALVLEVGAGLEPTFDWTPRCGVSELHVVYRDDDIPGYEFTAWMRFARSLEPPLRYAEPSSSSFPDLFPAEPLIAGRSYTVRLFVAPTPFGAILEVASKTFVP